MGHPSPPDYAGRGLVNVVNEVELRMSGSSPHPGLADDLAARIPAGRSYVIVLFDGLGASQLDHPEARDLARSMAGIVDAPFPTTTTVSLATIATGLVPAQHGLIGYLLWEPTAGTIINTIHMTSAWGGPLDLDLDSFVPSPRIWDRLTGAGIEPVVVQPFNFASSPLTKTLYGSTRFEGYHTPDDAVAVARDVASHPNRFVFLYVPFVDVAAHMAGQDSDAYTEAILLANSIWDRLSATLPEDVTMIGTADHGHVDIAETNKILLPDRVVDSARHFGDGRSMYVTGDPAETLDATGGVWVPSDDLPSYLGGGVDARYRDRMPDGVVLMPDGVAAFTPYMNDRLIGHHGGLTPAEREIPLLVRS